MHTVTEGDEAEFARITAALPEHAKEDAQSRINHFLPVDPLQLQQKILSGESGYKSDRVANFFQKRQRRQIHAL